MNDLTALFLIIAVGCQAGIVVLMWRAILNLEHNQRGLIRSISHLTNIVEIQDSELRQLQSADKIVRFPTKR